MRQWQRYNYISTIAFRPCVVPFVLSARAERRRDVSTELLQYKGLENAIGIPEGIQLHSSIRSGVNRGVILAPDLNTWGQWTRVEYVE